MVKKLLLTWLGLTLTMTLGMAQNTAELRGRFEQGRAAYNAGEYQRALGLFAQNLAADANSKGSLLYSALAHIQLGDFVTANGELDRFLQLEPNEAEGLIAAIKTKQALSKSAEVDVLRKRLSDNRAKGADPRLRVMMSYEREVIYQSDGSRISVLENFEPNGKYVWLYLVLDKDRKTVKRRVELAAAPTAAKTYVLGETKGDDASVSGYKIYKTYNGQPDYNNVKADALRILFGQ